MLGVKPEVPPIIVEKYIKEGHMMEDNVDKFRRWWMEYGREGVVRESQVIANYAGTNLLPRHVETEGGPASYTELSTTYDGTQTIT